jgi:plastocyanin
MFTTRGLREGGLVLIAVVVVAAACSSSKSSTSSGGAGTSAANTVNVNVDGKNANPAMTFTSYFPSAVTVHPGDTVQFTLQDTGEPHTVALGTLADAAVTAFSKLTPQQQQGQPPPAAQAADNALPQLLPNGPGDAVASAAVPCFLATANPPTSGACPAGSDRQPDFDGTQKFYNSGWLTADQPFVVKLASNIKPGVYQYMCLLHRESMSGKITVVPASTPVPSPAEQAQTGAQDLQKVVASLQPAVTALAQGKQPELSQFIPAGDVLAGSGLQSVQSAQIDGFGPKSVSIPVGGSVTWLVIGDHTISFNAPTSAQGVKTPGAPHINVQAAAPAGGPGFNPAAQNGGGPPSSGPPKPTITNGGKWDGTGFRSSGLALSFPPNLEGFKLTFTRAGTYTYKCLIHFNMEGTVKVG